MDDNLLRIVGSILSILFSGGGMIFYLLGRKERLLNYKDKSASTKEKYANADFLKLKALEIMQTSYDKWSAETDVKLDDMKKEIKELKEIIIRGNQICNGCPNNPFKRKR